MFFALNTSNPLFQFAHLAKKKPHFIFASILSLLFIILGQIIGFGIVSTIPSNLFTNNTWNITFTSFSEILLFFLPSIFIVAFWLKYYEKRKFESIGLERKNSIKKIIIGFGVGLLMFSLSILILYSLNYLEFENSSNTISGINYILPSLLILISYLIQGSTEEIVFRGWLLPILGTQLKPWLAILISSILFALLHSLNDNITIIAIVNLTLFGVFISLFALRQGSIWGVCSWHAIWNWLQGNFYGLEVSGNKENITIFNLKETGPDWLTGGNFGPEGGLIVTLILLIGSLILLALKNNIQNESIY
jgi:membrane protease YdiL (CAAX protease family)